jgi:hypothetical protein
MRERDDRKPAFVSRMRSRAGGRNNARGPWSSKRRMCIGDGANATAEARQPSSKIGLSARCIVSI